MAARAPSVPLVSPRIAALARQLGAGDRAALARFWQEAAATGTPLVEPVPDEAGQFLVTFLWRGRDGDGVENVVVVSPLGTDGQPDSTRMARLPGTDVWHRTYRARADLRLQYLLSPNDTGVPTRQPDPLNAHPWRIAREEAASDLELVFSSHWALSTVELPGAPPQPWCVLRPGTPTGRVERHQLRSPALGGEARRVWVYTPPGYATDGPPLSLLLLFDGWFYAYPHAATVTLDNLLAEGRLPPLVDSPLATRERDLRGSPAFAAFVTQELLPWVRARYSTATDPARVVVGGASASGFGAALLALDHPDLFGHVLSQSGGFTWSPDGDTEDEWLARQVAARPRAPVRFYLDVGLLETTYPRSRLLANRHLRTVLRAKGYPVHYQEFMGGHDSIWWRGTLADGLLALLGDQRGAP